MIDIHRIKDSVLDPILSFKDYDESGPERQTEIEADLAHSSPIELMDMFLNWEGIISYTSIIVEAWQSINAAVVDNPLERLIQYCWDDEQASYQEEYQLDDDIDIIAHALRNPNQEHIFCALAKLRMEAFEIARTTQIGYIQTTIAAMGYNEKEELKNWCDIEGVAP